MNGVSGISNSGGTTEEFVFNFKISSLIHQLQQDQVMGKVMDHSSEFVCWLLAADVECAYSNSLLQSVQIMKKKHWDWLWQEEVQYLQ